MHVLGRHEQAGLRLKGLVGGKGHPECREGVIFEHVPYITDILNLRKTVAVLSHRLKRTRTLTQNCLLGVQFDVCVHLHNKALVKTYSTNARAIDLAGRERHLPAASYCGASGILSSVPKKG
jgi:hypothetical protein